MAVLEYPYSPAGNTPEASCIAVNLLNGLSFPFFGVLDTGASITGLMEDVFWELGIDPKSLPEDDFDGSGGKFQTGFCDYIKIAFVVDFREHWPNGNYSVPVGVVHGKRNLLGRDLFLDRCILTFDGPRRIAYVDIPQGSSLSGRRSKK